MRNKAIIGESEWKIVFGWWIFCGTSRSVQVEIKVEVVKIEILFSSKVKLFWVNVYYRVLRSIDVDTVVVEKICRFLSDILMFIIDVVLLL